MPGVREDPARLAHSRPAHTDTHTDTAADADAGADVDVDGGEVEDVVEGVGEEAGLASSGGPPQCGVQPVAIAAVTGWG